MNTGVFDMNECIRKAVSEAIAQKFKQLSADELVHPPMMLTIEEICQELRLSKPVVYNIAKLPGFPAVHVGKKILVSRELLSEWISNNLGKTLLQ